MKGRVSELVPRILVTKIWEGGMAGQDCVMNLTVIRVSITCRDIRSILHLLKDLFIQPSLIYLILFHKIIFHLSTLYFFVCFVFLFFMSAPRQSATRLTAHYKCYIILIIIIIMNGSTTSKYLPFIPIHLICISFHIIHKCEWK